MTLYKERLQRMKGHDPTAEEIVKELRCDPKIIHLWERRRRMPPPAMHDAQDHDDEEVGDG